MGAIDIGNAAIDRTSYLDSANKTYIDLGNPANDSGEITSFEFWFVSGYNATGVKAGTFSGGSGTFNDRDYESIGNVTSGSKQTFSGLHCTVSTGDFVGFLMTAGRMEVSATGYTNVYEKSGDYFGAGSTSGYNLDANFGFSVYGIGATLGWANITKINGIAATSISKVNGIAVASISKVNGTAV